MTDDSRLRGISASLAKLATWLVEVDEEHWVSYRKSTCISQCRHPERDQKIAELLRWGIIDRQGKFAFLLRCRGPCSERLHATIRQTYPSEVILLLEDGSARATIEGEYVRPGETISYPEPPLLEVEAGSSTFMLAVFMKN